MFVGLVLVRGALSLSYVAYSFWLSRLPARHKSPSCCFVSIPYPSKSARARVGVSTRRSPQLRYTGKGRNDHPAKPLRLVFPPTPPPSSWQFVCLCFGYTAALSFFVCTCIRRHVLRRDRNYLLMLRHVRARGEYDTFSGQCLYSLCTTTIKTCVRPLAYLFVSLLFFIPNRPLEGRPVPQEEATPQAAALALLPPPATAATAAAARTARATATASTSPPWRPSAWTSS